nr:hypothetical protein CFP56_10982 [Quercus suber]
MTLRLFMVWAKIFVVCTDIVVDLLQVIWRDLGCVRVHAIERCQFKSRSDSNGRLGVITFNVAKGIPGILHHIMTSRTVSG